MRHSAFTKTMQVYGLSPPPKQDVPVGSTFTTSPMHTALACSVAVSVASLTADARSLSWAVPDPDTQRVSSLAPAIPMVEASKAAIVRMCFFMIVFSFSPRAFPALDHTCAAGREKGNLTAHNFLRENIGDDSPFHSGNAHACVKGAHAMNAIAALLCSAAAALAAHAPAADEIIAKVIVQDRARQASIGAYSVTSRYVLQNKGRHAEMVVRWTRQANGVKEFVILSEQGDGGVRKHVFHKLLEAEAEASQPEEQAQTRITPDNYSFRLDGTEQLEGHEAFVIELEPKTQNKYLTRGRIWVDACDFAVMRVEGAPARKVSFWTKDVNFVQTFEKNGEWWVPASNRSLTDARLFGLADLTIEYSEYELAKPAPVQTELAVRASIR
jgi:hypothetical protein